jgi:cytosine/adenosine deaminase-related metal-dependent hydrolase
MVQIEAHRAAWVAPIDAPPIEDGAVAIAAGRILTVGRAQEVLREHSGRVIDHGAGAILPALVNAHCHLEFSALHGRIPPQQNLGAWLEAAMAGAANLSETKIVQGVALALAKLRNSGTALVAETSNTGLSLPLLAQSPLEFHYFYECLGFNLRQPGPLSIDFPIFNTGLARGLTNFSAAAHAPYSVSMELFGRVIDWNRHHHRPGAVHLAESPEELQFLKEGGGVFQEILKQRGRWRWDYQPPGCSPVEYLDRLGFLDPQNLAVHCVWLDASDRELLARRRTRVVLCPRSNLYTGAGFPNLPELRRSGIRLALGTDSLAGNEDLNLFGEMLCLHQHFPEVPVGDLLAMGTVNGAQALGRESDFGSLAPGKKAALVFVPAERGPDFWERVLETGAAGRAAWIASPGGLT